METNGFADFRFDGRNRGASRDAPRQVWNVGGVI
jgi:hypothetical protein